MCCGVATVNWSQECLKRLVWFNFSWHLSKFKRGWSAYRREAENQTDWLFSGRGGCDCTKQRGGKEMRGIKGEALRERRGKTKWPRKCKGKIRERCTRMRQCCLWSLFNYMPLTMSWIDSLRQRGRTDNIIENSDKCKLVEKSKSSNYKLWRLVKQKTPNNHAQCEKSVVGFTSTRYWKKKEKWKSSRWCRHTTGLRWITSGHYTEILGPPGKDLINHSTLTCEKVLMRSCDPADIIKLRLADGFPGLALMAYINSITALSSGSQSRTCLQWLLILNQNPRLRLKPLTRVHVSLTEPSPLNVSSPIWSFQPSIMILEVGYPPSVPPEEFASSLQPFILSPCSALGPPADRGASPFSAHSVWWEGRTSCVNRGAVKFTTPTYTPSSHPSPPFGCAKPLSL